MLEQSARSRATLVKFATYQDADELRDIAENKPDVVLTDMWMPGMGGADLAAEIRKDESLDSVPLVAVTADNDVGATFDRSFFSAVVTKPVAAARLRQTFLQLFPGVRVK
ncbi:MAG: response regulator [Kiritimatiellae bacterium]|nr:response regulator [Kiritimatiellia bacterium]